MALRRSSRFGFPPPTPPSSQYTVRQVPLTQGVQTTTPWPLQQPGSAVSMTNFLPLDGVLVPRSRLSSINTLATMASIRGLAELVPANTASPQLWVSASTNHGLVASNGSISRASFTSAFGLGSVSVARETWQYAQVYDANLDDNMLLAVGLSRDTIQALYQTGSSVRYSYLTSAPKTGAVCVFDSYVIAWGVTSGSAPFESRVQWCVRGNPSNWTGEGSGFEDLLGMRGNSTAIKASPDGRLILFSTHEIWYGIGATYPAQFQFYPLDPDVGCPYPGTIQQTDIGIIFLGSDFKIRLLPGGTGVSRVIAPSLAPILRTAVVTSQSIEKQAAVFDPYARIYYLFVQNVAGASGRMAIAVNIDTGEWGYLDYPGIATDLTPTCGTVISRDNNQYVGVEGPVFGNLAGTTIYSTHSLLGTDSGSVVTSTHRSGPIATDLPGNWKQLTQADIDYRATSNATLTLKVSQDGGNTYESGGRTVPLASAPVVGRATSQMYLGGAFPAIELTSTSTGYELHRVDVTMNLGGRR